MKSSRRIGPKVLCFGTHLCNSLHLLPLYDVRLLARPLSAVIQTNVVRRTQTLVLFGSSSAPGIRYWRTERSQWLVLIGRDFFLPACMQPFTGSAWWHCQTGAEGEKNKHKQADTDWFSCVVMQSSTNSSVLSLPCKYLTDSYNSSPASAAHLNLFKSWTMSDWQLHTRAKKAACPGACKPQSLISDISC